MTVVIGKAGQVAQNLARLRPEATLLARPEAELAHSESRYRAIISATPTGVVTVAENTKEDRPDEIGEMSTNVKGTSPGAMSRDPAELGIQLVHVSTYDLFDGTCERPFAADAPTALLGVDLMSLPE